MSKKRPPSFEAFTTAQVVEFVKNEIPAISVEILETITAEKIDGEVLLEMSDGDLLEIAPRFGDRLKLKKAINRARDLVCPVSLFYIYCKAILSKN